MYRATCRHPWATDINRRANMPIPLGQQGRYALDGCQTSILGHRRLFTPCCALLRYPERIGGPAGPTLPIDAPQNVIVEAARQHWPIGLGAHEAFRRAVWNKKLHARRGASTTSQGSHASRT